jgi:hypothetical protein
VPGDSPPRSVSARSRGGSSVTSGCDPGHAARGHSAGPLGHWHAQVGLASGPAGATGKARSRGTSGRVCDSEAASVSLPAVETRSLESGPAARRGARGRPVRLDAACYWHIVYTTVVLCFLSCQCYSCLYIRKVPAGACTECRLKRTGRPRQRSSRIREVGAYNSRGSRDDYNKISENQSRPLSHCECFQDRV